MQKDDIIRMAREANILEPVDLLESNQWRQDTIRELERFAHLIYEATFRDANIAASRTILDAAVLEEREACAKVCDTLPMYGPNEETADWYGFALVDCAAAIRARGDK